MTFSLVGYDEGARSFGSVICSSHPAVAARCAHLADGAGAAHTQNITDPRLGGRVLALMAAGKPAGEAVSAVVAERPDMAGYRQLLAVDATRGTKSGRLGQNRTRAASVAGMPSADQANVQNLFLNSRCA